MSDVILTDRVLSHL